MLEMGNGRGGPAECQEWGKDSHLLLGTQKKSLGSVAVVQCELSSHLDSIGDSGVWGTGQPEDLGCKLYTRRA